MSIFFMVGLAPSNDTFPVMVPPLASSGAAVPPPAAAGASSFLAVSGVLPPQLVNKSAQATPAPIQIFFMLVRASFENRTLPQTRRRGDAEDSLGILCVSAPPRLESFSNYQYFPRSTSVCPVPPV